jgi:flagellar biosynthesis GTPase FlhF
MVVVASLGAVAGQKITASFLAHNPCDQPANCNLICNKHKRTVPNPTMYKLCIRGCQYGDRHGVTLYKCKAAGFCKNAGPPRPTAPRVCIYGCGLAVDRRTTCEAMELAKAEAEDKSNSAEMRENAKKAQEEGEKAAEMESQLLAERARIAETKQEETQKAATAAAKAEANRRARIAEQDEKAAAPELRGGIAEDDDEDAELAAIMDEMDRDSRL